MLTHSDYIMILYNDCIIIKMRTVNIYMYIYKYIYIYISIIHIVMGYGPWALDHGLLTIDHDGL